MSVCFSADSPERVNSPELVDSPELVNSPERVNSPELTDKPVLGLFNHLGAQNRDSITGMNGASSEQFCDLVMGHACSQQDFTGVLAMLRCG